MEAEIEEGLAHTDQVTLSFQIFENTPPSVILDYTDQGKTNLIRNSYELLVKEFTNGNNVLIIYPKENLIHLSILNTISLKTINIRNLETMGNDLKNFKKLVPLKSEITFYIHFAGVDYLMIDKRKKLIISEYKIAE